MPTREVPRTKICSRCQAEKPAEAFQRNKRMKTGLSTYCRECSAEVSRTYRAEHPEKFAGYEATRVRTTEQRWAAKLWITYRIRPAEYYRMLEQQLGRCAVCYEPAEGKLNVDHDHETGKVRGLLCLNCNLMLGHARDNAATLAAAITYLESHA